MVAPLCVKIRSGAALSGNTYNVVLRLIRRCFADARQSNLPVEYVTDSIHVRFEVLDEQSEEIPYQKIKGMIVDVSNTDWDLATSICRVPTKDPNELPDRLAAGECFRDFEGVRLFMKFGESENQANHYDRLTEKIKKNSSRQDLKEFWKDYLVEVSLIYAWLTTPTYEATAAGDPLRHDFSHSVGETRSKPTHALSLQFVHHV